MNHQPFTQEQIEAKKMLLWLSFECALGGNPADCPVHALRLRSYEERRRMLAQMSGAEYLQLYALHRLCQARKESQLSECCGSAKPAELQKASTAEGAS